MSLSVALYLYSPISGLVVSQWGGLFAVNPGTVTDGGNNILSSSFEASRVGCDLRRLPDVLLIRAKAVLPPSSLVAFISVDKEACLRAAA